MCLNIKGENPTLKSWLFPQERETVTAKKGGQELEMREGCLREGEEGAHADSLEWAEASFLRRILGLASKGNM